MHSFIVMITAQIPLIISYNVYVNELATDPCEQGPFDELYPWAYINTLKIQA